jgi:hypothetical protein
MKSSAFSDMLALLATSFHDGFFFDPEHIGDMFLQNVG